MDYSLKSSPTFESVLYIGSKEGYHGKEFTKDELVATINQYQKSCDSEHKLPVRIMECEYTFEDYREKGWEVSAISYPNRPKEVVVICEFIEGLAQHLLKHFNQNRITVRHLSNPSYNTLMFERTDAEETHEK